MERMSIVFFGDSLTAGTPAPHISTSYLSVIRQRAADNARLADVRLVAPGIGGVT